MLVDDALLQEVREAAPEHTVSIREHADSLYTRVSRQEIYVETQIISWPERIHQQLLVAVDRLAREVEQEIYELEHPHPGFLSNEEIHVLVWGIDSPITKDGWRLAPGWKA